MVPIFFPLILSDIVELFSPRTENFKSCHLPVVRAPEGRLMDAPVSCEKVAVSLSPKMRWNSGSNWPPLEKVKIEPLMMYKERLKSISPQLRLFAWTAIFFDSISVPTADTYRKRSILRLLINARFTNLPRRGEASLTCAS